MIISNYNSSKIKIFNTVLILMVLYIHSYYLEGEQYTLVLALQRFLGGSGVFIVANNLFFLLSGLLFFNGINTVKDCLVKIKKRIRTLVIPYLLWNIIFVLWYVLLAIIPGVKPFVNSDVLSLLKDPLTAFKYLYIEPANFPLWFIRDLISFTFLSPLIYYYLKYMKWWGVVLYCIVSQFIPLHGWCFMLGGFIALYSNIENIDYFLSKRIVVSSAVIFVGISAYVSLQSVDYHLNYWIVVLQIITGLVTIWKAYDYIATGRHIINQSLWTKVLGYSFFIYLFHEPVFNIVKKLNIMIWGTHAWSLILLFLVNPIIMISISIWVAKVLQYLFPRAYNILVGGR